MKDFNSNRRDRILIEFVGLPCSGKTTIANEIVKELKKEKIEVSTPIKNISSELTDPWKRYLLKIMKSVRYFFNSPKIYSQSCKNIYNINNSKKKAISLALYSGYVYREYQSNWANNEIKVFDQGLFQLLWSIYFHSEFNERHSSIIEKVINRSNIDKWIIINIKCNNKTIQKRLNSREIEKSRLTSDNVYAADKLLQNIVEKQKYYKIKHKNVTILDLENNYINDMNKNVDYIFNELKSDTY